MGLSSKSDLKVVVCFDFCLTDELVLSKSYIRFVIVVSSVFVLDYKWGKILRKWWLFV